MLRAAPAAITDLSPQVHAITVPDPAGHTIASLRFEAPAGQLPVSVEVRAVSALLQDEATMAGRSGR
jgi:hypothetical protein